MLQQYWIISTLWLFNILQWKITILMGKSTISMAIFNSKLLNYQRVIDTILAIVMDGVSEWWLMVINGNDTMDVDGIDTMLIMSI